MRRATLWIFDFCDSHRLHPEGYFSLPLRYFYYYYIQPLLETSVRWQHRPLTILRAARNQRNNKDILFIFSFYGLVQTRKLKHFLCILKKKKLISKVTQQTMFFFCYLIIIILILIFLQNDRVVQYLQFAPIEIDRIPGKFPTGCRSWRHFPLNGDFRDRII